jgi:sugar porter (SP) family MFS transporter
VEIAQADAPVTGFFVSYAASKTMADTREQYRVVQAIPLIPVGIAFICTFWLAETPRWLISRHRVEEAQQALARLQGVAVDDPYLAQEFCALQQQIEANTNDTRERSTKDLFREIWSPRYRGRFLLSLAFQTFGQWSGGNGITYYVPQIFQYAGVTGDSVSLVASGAYGIVKLLASTLTAFFLVDRIGRRPLFLSGLLLQMVTHVYMAAYMGEQPGSGQNKAASNAAIASVFIYALGWSTGLCILQSIYGTEMFPTRLRGICYAITMTVHWFFQFAVVRVTPNMLTSLNVWGAYVFWASICGIGFVVLGIWAPETKRVPLEKMDELFEGPWYKTWKAKASRGNIDGTFEAQDMMAKGLQRLEVHHVEEGKAGLEKSM